MPLAGCAHSRDERMGRFGNREASVGRPVLTDVERHSPSSGGGCPERSSSDKESCRARCKRGSVSVGFGSDSASE